MVWRCRVQCGEYFCVTHFNAKTHINNCRDLSPTVEPRPPSPIVDPSLLGNTPSTAQNSSDTNGPEAEPLIRGQMSRRARTYKRASGRTSKRYEKTKQTKETDLVEKTARDLTEEEKEVRRKLQVSVMFIINENGSHERMGQQTVVRNQLKVLTGIESNRKQNKKDKKKAEPELPGPDAEPRLNSSGQPYMRPRFDQDVTHPENQAILDRAVELSQSYIKVIAMNLEIIYYSHS